MVPWGTCGDVRVWASSCETAPSPASACLLSSFPVASTSPRPTFPSPSTANVIRRESCLGVRPHGFVSPLCDPPVSACWEYKANRARAGRFPHRSLDLTAGLCRASLAADNCHTIMSAALMLTCTVLAGPFPRRARLHYNFTRLSVLDFLQVLPQILSVDVKRRDSRAPRTQKNLHARGEQLWCLS